MNQEARWTIRWLGGVHEADRHRWDRLARPIQTPLLEWPWLYYLEASGSISARLGWQPCHLTVWDRHELIGAAPLYIKTHSEGEFIFDHMWAQLAARFGIAYYPKMVGMSPATPCAGYRFLMAEGIDRAALMRRMLSAIDRYCRQARLSCCHLNFVDLPWFSRWPLDGFIPWRHQAFLWRNKNYHSFEEYLGAFTSSHRRNIRRERRRMDAQGITIRALAGDDIPEDMHETMYAYYLKTNARYGPWAARYLNGDFFRHIFKHYRHRMLIFVARRGDSSPPAALSLLLVKDRHLIGRYWGCEKTVKDLHFNMCFYAPIEWAIENGIQTFDPGAGSPHKIQRGFSAVANTSLHRFYDPRLGGLFRHLIDEVNEMVTAEIDALNRLLPFARRG
jgi:hypothetical protein